MSPQSNSSKPLLRPLKRDESNISMISEIVKKKRITFLKSASLFADEDEIFGSPNKD